MAARRTTAQQKSARTDPDSDDSSGFSAEERAAMKDRARELRSSRSSKRTKTDPEADLLAAIAAMPESDRVMAEAIHALVSEHAPELAPRTWYGMPAWAKDGTALCFFQSAAKFKSRYATLGFNAGANLDEGDMWPTSFALLSIGPAEEARIAELLRRAVG